MNDDKIPEGCEEFGGALRRLKARFQADPCPNYVSWHEAYDKCKAQRDALLAACQLVPDMTTAATNAVYYTDRMVASDWSGRLFELQTQFKLLVREGTEAIAAAEGAKE